VGRLVPGRTRGNVTAERRPQGGVGAITVSFRRVRVAPALPLIHT